MGTVGPVPARIRVFFTDPAMAAKLPKGVAVPLGINRSKVGVTLANLCGGNAAGTCYGNVNEASKPDVLGVDLDAILEYLEESTWSGKDGGKMLQDHGFQVVDVSDVYLHGSIYPIPYFVSSVTVDTTWFDAEV